LAAKIKEYLRDKRYSKVLTTKNGINYTIRFRRAIVRFTSSQEGLEVDGYQTPDGEYRVGITGAAKVLGYGKQWIVQFLTRGGYTLESLQGMGFTGSQITGTVAERGEGVRGASQVSTMSLQDFTILIFYAASQKKKAAIALQLALTEMSLGDFFRDAFGERPLTMDEKRQNFYLTYGRTINWLQEDRVDVDRLLLSGDPKELQGWNAPVRWID
jgi:hypothetical protein